MSGCSAVTSNIASSSIMRRSRPEGSGVGSPTEPAPTPALVLRQRWSLPMSTLADINEERRCVAAEGLTWACSNPELNRHLAEEWLEQLIASINETQKEHG